MRFNKTIFVLLIGASLTLPPLQPSEAKQQSAGDQSAAAEKNEGRKLSMTVPGIGTAHITVTPTQVSPILRGKPFAPARHLVLGQHPGDASGAKKDLSIETSGNNITVRVPPSVDAAIDDAQVVSRQLGKYASKSIAGVSRFVDLLVIYIKQWSGTTTITPGGYPYVQKSSNIDSFNQTLPGPLTIASGHKLYYTTEGRLKSVVSH